MKTKAPAAKESLGNKENLEALINRARHGKKSGDPHLVLVIDCLDDVFAGAWTELPDGVHLRRCWGWPIHHSAENTPYSNPTYIPWNPKVDGSGAKRNALINRFMLSVLDGDYREIRRIAEAVKRAYEWMNDEAGYKWMDVAGIVSLKPSDPKLVDLLRICSGSERPKTAREFKKIIDDLGIKISERTERRLRKGLSIRAAVRGRPRKYPK